MMAPQLWDLTGRILSDSNWIWSSAAGVVCLAFITSTRSIGYCMENSNFLQLGSSQPPSPPSLKRNNSGAPASRPSIVVVSPISRKDSFKCYFDLFCLASLKAHSHQQGVTGLMLIKDILNVVRQCLEIMWEKCHGLWFLEELLVLAPTACSTSSKILIDHHCQINGIFSKMFWILSAAFVYYFQSAL